MLYAIVSDIEGVPDLLLSGNEIIPMALVAIPDIGTHDEGMALICRHGITGIPPTSAIDDWKFVSEENMEESITPDLGWSISRGQSDGVVRLERIEGLSPLEGTYKCSVHRIDIGEDTFESVTVYLYWPGNRFCYSRIRKLIPSGPSSNLNNYGQGILILFPLHFPTRSQIRDLPYLSNSIRQCL